MGRRTAVLGIASGLICALCVGLYAAQLGQEAQLQRAEALEKYGGTQVEVYVARRDLAAGEMLDDAAVERRQWLAELLPEGAVTNFDEARGLQLGSSIFAGEVVCTGRLQVVADQLVVPEGLCALSVPAKDVQAVGGSLTAGMEADLYMTGPSGSALLASRVPVLAVGKEGGLASGTCWVTIAVAPVLVQELVQAAQAYELYFVLPGVAAGVPAVEMAEGLGEVPAAGPGPDDGVDEGGADDAEVIPTDDEADSAVTDVGSEGPEADGTERQAEEGER